VIGVVHLLKIQKILKLIIKSFTLLIK